VTREVRIGCLQTRPLATFDEAIAEARRLAGDAVAAGAELVCLPEYCGGLKSENGLFAPPTAPEAQHPVLDALRSFATDAGVWMLIGSIAVDGPGDRLVNRGYAIDDRGDIRARYDKIFLFDVDLSPTQQYRESAVVAPGEQAVVVDTPWGRLGMTICYDLRFPQLYRDLAQAGAEILAVPAAFTKVTGEAHWHVLNRARAIENGAVVVAPCAVGAVPGGGAAYGHSLVVSPWGEVLADGGDGVGYVVTTVDIESVASARSRIPSLQHDRRFSHPEVSEGTRSEAA
jgi:predicted amidohydrolase